MIYLLTYELRTPDMDYSPLYNHLEKEMGEVAIRVLRDSWWIKIDDSRSIEGLVNEVRNYLGEQDVLFITQIIENGYNGWLPSSTWDWLRENL
jgi:hypothetical protein